MKLTNCQTKALKKLNNFYKSGERLFLLYGSAGTGKTFLSKSFIDSIGGNVQGTAPTHKAVEVLSNRLGLEGRTIHSFLGLKLKRVKAEYVLVQNKATYLKNTKGTRLVIVDEASMIDDTLLDFIIEDVNSSSNRQYVFMGDICQLPPVGYETSPVFEEIVEDCCVAQLNEIVRQGKDSIIIRNATKLREKILNGTSYELEFDEEFTAHKRDDFLDEINKSDMVSYDNKIIAFTNKRVHQYNKFCNKLLGVPVENKFILGQKVLFNEMYEQHGECVANTGHVCNIIDYEEFYDVETGLNAIKIGVDTKPQEILVLAESSENKYLALKEKLIQDAYKNKINWKYFYALIERYADIRPVFSSTTHKVQGETIHGTVFIDYSNIQTCQDELTRDKMLYTAITRATKYVKLKF